MIVPSWSIPDHLPVLPLHMGGPAGSIWFPFACPYYSIFFSPRNSKGAFLFFSAQAIEPPVFLLRIFAQQKSRATWPKESVARFSDKNKEPPGIPGSPFVVTYRRLELRTPWLKVRCSTDWANGSSYVSDFIEFLRISFAHKDYYISFCILSQHFYYNFLYFFQ